MSPLPYQSIDDLIVHFLQVHNLAAVYIETLEREKSCIGCTRTNGDHDDECLVFMDRESYVTDVSELATTSQGYEDQIKEIKKYRL